MKTMERKRREAQRRTSLRDERSTIQQLHIIDQRRGLSHLEMLRLQSQLFAASDDTAPKSTHEPHLKAKDRRRNDRNQHRKGH